MPAAPLPPTPTEPGLGGVDVAGFAAASAGAGLAVDAVLVGEAGASSLGPAVTMAPVVLAAIAGLGCLVAALPWLLGGRRTRQAAGRSLPQLYPFGPPWIQFALFVLVLLGTASVEHASLVVFTGADASGAIESPTGPTPFELLLAAGSLVVWGLTLYAVFGLYRFIQVGRTLDARRGVDPFRGRSAPARVEEPGWAPGRRPRGPSPEGLRGAIGAVTAVLLVEISVGIQVLETPIGPPPAAAFWWSQLLTLGAAGLLTSALVAIDRGVRDLERQYAAMWASVPDLRATSNGPPAERFVQ